MKRYAVLTAAMCSAALALPAAAQPSARDVAREAGAMLMAKYRADAPGGVVLVARGDTVLFRAARGEADAEKHVPLRPDSMFRIGSATKQFAAAGLLKLVEAGKVKLHDPLSKYVPGYPGGEGITVLQLLNHTSGVKGYTALKGYMAGPVQRDLTTAQMIDVFKNEAPDFAPGTRWNYSNSGYVLVGAVIEAASGMPWHAYLDRVLFKPLGMKHTGYGHDPKIVAQQVHGYTYHDGKLLPARAISMTQPHGAGSLVSNADDLLKWNRALHEGRVLKTAAYTQMITPAGRAADVGYGFGLFKDVVRKTDRLWHGGGIFGFISSLNYLQGPDISVIVLENDDEDDDEKGGDSADTFARRLAAVAMGDPYPAMRAVAVEPAVLKAAEGEYRFEGEVTRTLRVIDGKLTARRGRRGEPQVLTPIGADDFLYPDGFNRLKLVRDGAGKIGGARFFASGDGDGAVGTRAADTPATGQAAPAFERVIGTYANQGIGLTLKVFVEGQGLVAQIAGQPPVTLRATSANKFDVEETGASVEFSAGDAPAGEVTMRQGGRELVLKRMP